MRGIPLSFNVRLWTPLLSLPNQLKFSVRHFSTGLSRVSSYSVLYAIGQICAYLYFTPVNSILPKVLPPMNYSERTLFFF